MEDWTARSCIVHLYRRIIASPKGEVYLNPGLIIFVDLL